MVEYWEGSNKSRERRTRQATMVFRPSVFEAIQKAAYVNKSSITNFVEGLMEKYLKDHPEVIEQYDKVSK